MDLKNSKKYSFYLSGRFGHQGNIQSLSCQEFEDEEENVVLQKRKRRLVKLGIGGVMGVGAGIGGNVTGRKSTRRLKKILMEGGIGIQVG